MEQQRNYKNDFLNYYSSTAVKSNCGDITFYNQGSTNIRLNGSLILRPGSSVALTANANELDLTIYNITFESVAGLVDELVVIRKIFI